MEDSEPTAQRDLVDTEVLEPNPAEADSPVCPRCHRAYQRDSIEPPEYKCSCGLELAYPEITASGVVKGVYGWLSSPGDILNQRYKVIQLLGRGGFGSTYLVEDMKLSQKRWALKEIPEEMYDEHESRILSKLNHPSVPTITDREIVDGMVYMVLEFGGNRTLESVRRESPEKRVGLAQMAPWARQLCDVIGYMHAQTPPVIHRDLKPANVLLDDQDRVMLIDFGIAKEEIDTESTHTLGRAVTHGFSPPEQAMGSGTDARSDIYALGATIYFMLTSQRPAGARERIQGIEIVPPSSLAEGIPPGIDRALLQSLALNPNERQQTVEEFGSAFDYDAPTVTTYDDMGGNERTVLVGSATTAPTGATTMQSQKSLKLGADGGAVVVEAAAGGTSGSKKLGMAIAAGVVIAVCAVAAYMFMQKEQASTEADKPATAATQEPKASELAGQSGAAPATAQPAAPSAAGTTMPPAQATQQAPTLPVAAMPNSSPAAPASPTSSAMDELLKRRSAPAEAPATPIARPAPVAKARPKPAAPPPKKVAAVAKTKPAAATPAPPPAKPASAASAWQKANANTKFQE